MEKDIEFKVGNWFSFTHYCEGYQPPLRISKIDNQVYYFDSTTGSFAYYSQINSVLLCEKNLESFGFTRILSADINDLKYFKDFLSKGKDGRMIINVTTALAKVQVFINGEESVHYWNFAHEMQNAMQDDCDVDILPGYSDDVNFT